MEKVYMCFDIGGLSLKMSIYNENRDEKLNEILNYKLMKRELIFENIHQIYLKHKANFNIAGICISSSGIIDFVNKKIIHFDSENGFTENDINQIMNWCEIPWLIENDARCALFAEKYFGKAKNYKNVTLFTIGTALGGAVLIEGKLFRGTNNLAAEIGCGIFDVHDVTKNNSVKTGINGMNEIYNLEKSTNLTGREIIDLAEKGDAFALKIVEERISNIAMVIFNTQLAYDSELFLIGGGVSANEWFMKKLELKTIEVSKRMGLPWTAKLESCQFNNEAGKIGALSLMLNN